MVLGIFTRFIVRIVLKVFDYLEQSIAYNQMRESITELAEKCKKYKLADAEIVNIINIRPSSAVEIEPVTLLEWCYEFLSHD